MQAGARDHRWLELALCAVNLNAGGGRDHDLPGIELDDALRNAINGE